MAITRKSKLYSIENPKCSICKRFHDEHTEEQIDHCMGFPKASWIIAEGLAYPGLEKENCSCEIPEIVRGEKPWCEACGKPYDTSGVSG
jgi:hypothetical protein